MKSIHNYAVMVTAYTPRSNPGFYSILETTTRSLLPSKIIYMGALSVYAQRFEIRTEAGFRVTTTASGSQSYLLRIA